MENGNAYTTFVQTIIDVAQHIGYDLKLEHIPQWHGDMHKGIEAATKSVAEHLKRVSDWAHVTGATSEGPAGVHGLASKLLGPEKKVTTSP